MHRGLVYAVWRFCQSCEVLQNQLYISKGGIVVLKCCCCNSGENCEMGDFKEPIFKVDLNFPCCSVLNEKKFLSS